MIQNSTVQSIVHNIKNGNFSATQVTKHYIDLINHHNASLNAVTHMLTDQALQAAYDIDRLIEQGKKTGPLAGVPFGVKALFDVAGQVTTAGAKQCINPAPAHHDAHIISQLKQAGAIPLAILNMDEFAYGFVTDNAHYGITLNPHDPKRFAGGSSGGSAASVAAGILPFSLGSDTNGSIRVPASLCGVWGLRPTYDSLSLEGVFPFCHSLDTIGPFCQTSEDLRSVFQTLTSNTLAVSINPEKLRIAQLVGWFEQDVDQDILESITQILSLFKHTAKIDIPDIATVRAASFIMTAAEGGSLHLPFLKKQSDAYDPATRDRLTAGAMLPVSTYLKTKKIQSWFQNEIGRYFETHDILIAPATGSVAPLIDHPFVKVNGQEVSARVNLGIYTQPISLSGYPVLSLPLNRQGKLPAGLQVIAKPNQENLLLALATFLEKQGVAKSSIQARTPISC